MRAGPLTERIELLEPATVESASGASAERWLSRGIHRAQLKAITGNAQINGGEIFGAQHATFIVRWSIEVKEGWRLRHIGGEIYKIIAPPTRLRALAMQTITCERVNN